jgi:hypothetical protein
VAASGGTKFSAQRALRSSIGTVSEKKLQQLKFQAGANSKNQG